MNLISQLEAILFVASKPLSLKALVNATSTQKEDVEQAVQVLCEKFNTETSGIHILESDGMFQMVTNPNAVQVVDAFIEKEIKSELTRAQLETLTVIAYRGPLTRPEIEQIRGVNCALILRNLLMRGLIDEKAESNDRSTIIPPLPPPSGSPTTAHFIVIQKDKAFTSSKLTPG